MSESNKETETLSTVDSLRGHIQDLTELANRLQSIRQIPTLLRGTGISRELPQFDTTSLRIGFQDLAELKDAIVSEKVQAALNLARECEKADGVGLSLNWRRGNQKRRRPPSPASPKPVSTFHRKSPSVFPPLEYEGPALGANGLPQYIRDHNKTHASKLHIWARTRADTGLGNPILVRLTIPDVFTMFIALGNGSENGPLIAESLRAFGPREKKPPHSHSEYTVYQKLSQHVARMVHSDPRISFQRLMHLLLSYENLFVASCVVCQRILSVEGHIPPVARVWVQSSTEVDGGNWKPRHTACLQV